MSWLKDESLSLYLRMRVCVYVQVFIYIISFSFSLFAINKYSLNIFLTFYLDAVSTATCSCGFYKGYHLRFGCFFGNFCCVFVLFQCHHNLIGLFYIIHFFYLFIIILGFVSWSFFKYNFISFFVVVVVFYISQTYICCIA